MPGCAVPYSAKGNPAWRLRIGNARCCSMLMGCWCTVTTLRAFHLWTGLGLKAHFDDTFYAARLGVTKPGRGFFERVDAIIGPQPRPPLFFDDNAGVVRAACAFGLDGRACSTSGSKTALSIPGSGTGSAPLQQSEADTGIIARRTLGKLICIRQRTAAVDGENDEADCPVRNLDIPGDRRPGLRQGCQPPVTVVRRRRPPVA